LLAVGFGKVKKDFLRQFAMTRSTGGEEQQRILLPHRIGFLDFTEQAGRVGELRLELGADFFANFIAAALNPGADSGLQIARTATEAAHHLSDALLDDALDGPAPAGVEYADDVAPGVDDNDREAVCRLNREQQAGSCGDHAIAGQW